MTTVASFTSLATKYLAIVRPTIRHATYRNYSSLVSVLQDGETFLDDQLESLRRSSKASTHRQRVQICNIILKYYGEQLLVVPKNRRIRRPVPQVLPRVVAMAKDGHVPAQLFMLAYSLGGVRYSDLVRLKRSHISAGYITYQQSKTGYNVSMPLNEQALWCIHVLRGGEYLVPRKWIANWRINKHLKEIHPQLQLHDARRMMATHLHQHGYPLATIQAIGGWASVDTAMLYCGTLPDDHLRSAVNSLFAHG